MVSRVGSNQFSKRLRLQANKIEGRAGRIVQDAASAAFEVMVLSTRIDTSRAVSNWIVTRDGPSRDYIEAHNPGKRGSTAGPSIAETLARGRSEIEQFRIGQDADLFITNNTPYLRYIEGSEITAMGQAAARAAINGAKLLG